MCRTYGAPEFIPCGVPSAYESVTKLKSFVAYCGCNPLKRNMLWFQKRNFEFCNSLLRTGLTCAAPTALRNPIEELVPCAGYGEEPGAAVVQAEWRAGEGNCGEGIFVAARISVAPVQNCLRDFVTEVGGYRHAVTRIAEGEVETVELTGMRHDVEREIERAAPNVFDCGVAQLRVNAKHAAAENFRAAANGAAGFGEERGSAAEQHAAVGREAIVVKIVLGIVDHAIARAQLGSQFFGQNFGNDDVRADGNDFLLQRGSDAGGVAAGGDYDVVRAQCAACGGNFPAARAFALNLINMRALEDGGSGALRGAGEAGDQAGGVYSGAGIVDQAAVIDGRADFGLELILWNQALVMMEMARGFFRAPAEIIKVFPFAGDFEMAAAREIAGDIFFAH
jgi:hypothetical protein